MTSKTLRRNNSHTQTRKKKIVPLSLPELKGSFDRLRKECSEILRGKKDTKQRIKEFQKLWKDIFHHPVDATAAEAYLRVMGSSVARGKTAKGRASTKKQKGGAAPIAGAPIDFQTRPGLDGVHGSFPQYLTAGLGFYNTINQEGMFKDCGVVDNTPVVPESIGSNKVGGGGKSAKGGGIISDFMTLATTRPIESTVPANPLQDAQTAWGGRALGASPLPEQNPLKYV